MPYRATVQRSFLIAAVLFVAGAVLLAANAFRREQPKVQWIEFQTLSHDFGAVFPGQTLHYEFAFKNVGPETLRILDLATSCGCTAADLPVRIYKPGESGVIKVTFRLPPHPDPVAHSVTVTSNDPMAPERRLIITADPEWPVATTPEAIHFPPAPEGSVLERRLEVFTPSGKPFDVTDIKTSSSGVRLHERERVDRRRLYDVEVRPDRPGSVREWIEIHTDAPGRELIRIPIDGTIGATEKVVPSRLILGQRAPAESLTRRLVIADPSLGEVETVRVEKSESWTLVDWSVVAARTIEVRLKAPDSDGYHSCSLEVSFGGAAAVSVPVSCIIRRRDTIDANSKDEPAASRGDQ